MEVFPDVRHSSLLTILREKQNHEGNIGMKIVLAALNAKYVHSNLAVYDLQAYAEEQLNKERNELYKAEKAGIPEIVIKEYTINHNLDLILQSLYQEKAAVVAFSCYIWNVHEILIIAKELSKVSPKMHIWLGGPEVSYNSEKLLEEHPFIEGIIQGEGEVTFYELVKVWSCLDEKSEDDKLGRIADAGINGKDHRENILEKSDKYSGVLGITYRDLSGKICGNGKRPLMSLDDVPFIYRDLSKFENKILYYESSRGCPFSCSYCLSSIDKSVRFRSIELVEKELQFFLDHKVSQVKFIDRTFNCKREHSLAIWRYLLEHDNGITNFHFEVAADLIGEEELAVLSKMRPGLIQLEIGLQSTNPATIREIHRVMDVERLKKNMLTIKGFHNIHQHLDLIAGLPFEDVITFKQSFNEAYEMKPNQLQLGFLKVLKGSYMGEQINEYGLQYQDNQPYEVLSTKWISYDEILALKQVEEMVEVYYNSAQFEHVLNYVISFFESSYDFFEAIGTYYAKNQLYGIGFKREARYNVLRSFCMEWFKKCDRTFSAKILDSLLVYDYYLRENAKSRPAWSPEEPIEKQKYQDFFKRGGTEEIHLGKEGYDSKVAARVMHIEPVAREAVLWITDSEMMADEKVSKNSDAMMDSKNVKSEEDIAYCLFNYENRNPLSKDASVAILSHL
ncbi:MAG: B12-binding domain-containing radical SAM protein [Clostridiales bacterium]|nr:B12-binding domain-containing radical SAM protein [Clostridiales bacterium]